MQPDPVSAETMKVRSKATRSIGLLGERQQRFGLHPVDLVEDQHLRLAAQSRACRACASASPLMPRSASISTSTTSASLAPPQAVVDHRLVEPAARLEDARRVDEDDLRVVVRGDAAHDGARRLHLVGDDRDLRADQPVDQRRLAGVRRADQRDEAGAGGSGRLPAFRLTVRSSACVHTPSRSRKAVGGGLLGRALGAPAARAGWKPPTLHADGEAAGRGPAPRGSRSIGRRAQRVLMATHSCSSVLGSRRLARARLAARLPVAQDEGARRLHAAFEIDRGDQRLDRVGATGCRACAPRACAARRRRG